MRQLSRSSLVQILPWRLFGVKPFLNKWWLYVKWAAENKLQRSLNQNRRLFFEETALKISFVEWQLFYSSLPYTLIRCMLGVSNITQILTYTVSVSVYDLFSSDVNPCNNIVAMKAEAQQQLQTNTVTELPNSSTTHSHKIQPNHNH